MAENPQSLSADDVKAKMREALERKKAGANHGPNTGAAGKGGVAAAHERAGGKRAFRRKSS